MTQGLMQVMCVVVMFWVCEGSCVFSSRSQTSRFPSSLPMKKTAGRVRDQKPTVHFLGEQGDSRIGPFWREAADRVDHN